MPAQFNFMGVFKEFKDFAIRGNVVDLAVGVIIGGAFGKIVTSLVNDLIMPPIGFLIGGVKFTDLKITIKEAVLDKADKVLEPAVTVNYGTFIQMVFEFFIIAFAVFMMVKLMNRMHLSTKKEEAAKAAANPAPEPEPTKEQKLLTEIRDLLKEQR